MLARTCSLAQCQLHTTYKQTLQGCRAPQGCMRILSTIERERMQVWLLHRLGVEDESTGRAGGVGEQEERKYREEWKSK